MGNVRPFVEEDIPRVADLHRRVFNTGDERALDLQRSYQSYFSQVYLGPPWRDPALPSLVYEETAGDICGFLGVLPRPMSMNGRPVRAAVSSQFIVDPARRSTLAAVQMLKVFLSGPQELSIADEANDASRKLWERFGGTTTRLLSLSWVRLLRPAQAALSRFGKGTSAGGLWSATAPFCRVVDAMIMRLPQFRLKIPSMRGEDLAPETLATCLPLLSEARWLRPEYDPSSLGWLFDLLGRGKGHGRFRKVGVRKPSGEIAGWYLYYANPGGMGEVLQIGAARDTIIEVLDHLFYHAWRAGVTALTGRLEPRFMEEFSMKGSFLHHRGHWLLVHSKSREMMDAIHRGETSLTRLDGEWGLRFDAGRTTAKENRAFEDFRDPGAGARLPGRNRAQAERRAV